jgi:hypothetical protein
MFRKILITLAALSTLGVAAVAPTVASAHWNGGWHGGWHSHFFHGHFFGPGVAFYAGPGYYNPCLHREWIATPFGPRPRWVNVCY